MTKTVFVNGTVVTPEWLNAVNNPQFVEAPDNDGEIARITNEALSNTPGQLKPEWQSFRDALKVSAGTGLSVAYQGGLVRRLNGTQFTLAPGAIAVPNDATSYISVNEADQVVVSPDVPLKGLLLAKVTTAGGAIASIEDLRPRYQISPLGSAIQIFGGSGEQGDFILASGSQTLSGVYSFRNFTLGEAASLNINGIALIRCTGKVEIRGNIIVTGVIGGGASVNGGAYPLMHYPFANGLGLGGGGCQGSLGQAYSWSSGMGLNPGSGGGGSPVIVGGAPGQAAISVGASQGGLGGGVLAIQAGGEILVAGTILANGGNASPSVIFDNSSSLPILLGGGGGGSGGLIYLASLSKATLAVSANLQVKGGNGSNGLGAFAGSTSAGGGGGGGGYVVLVAPSLVTSGSTILLSGGLGGAAVGSGGVWRGAQGGSFGGLGGNGESPAQAGGNGQLILNSFLPS
jgi:hypothetical protein